MNFSLKFTSGIVENPHLSLRRARDELDVAPERVRNILKSINFHPYKVHLVQELNEDDPDRRVEFCELRWTELIEILFSYKYSIFR